MPIGSKIWWYLNMIWLRREPTHAAEHSCLNTGHGHWQPGSQRPGRASDCAARTAWWSLWSLRDDCGAVCRQPLPTTSPPHPQATTSDSEWSNTQECKCSRLPITWPPKTLPFLRAEIVDIWDWRNRPASRHDAAGRRGQRTHSAGKLATESWIALYLTQRKCSSRTSASLASSGNVAIG